MLKIGTRPSPLAIKQVEEIQNLMPLVRFKVVVIETRGDKDRYTPISEIEGSDFFTKEIDEALLKGEIDLAVHSSKDLPGILTTGLKVILETKSISPYDALVSRGNFKLAELPKGSRIGTSSQRRKDGVRILRPDLKIIDIRGNVDERFFLIDSGEIDALIVAYAALIRLGVEYRISEIFPLNIFKAHPKQGRLSLVAKEERWQEVKFILSAPAPVIGS